MIAGREVKCFGRALVVDRFRRAVVDGQVHQLMDFWKLTTLPTGRRK